jgi:hypothetical protein
VLAKWLAGDGWTKPPPERWRAQATRGRSSHRNGHKANCRAGRWLDGLRRRRMTAPRKPKAGAAQVQCAGGAGAEAAGSAGSAEARL